MFKIIILLTLLHQYTTIDVPIIGILSQPSEDYGYDTFIAASYVKFLETAGARVIPVWVNQTYGYYERVVNYTNGVLFPGGSPTPFGTPGSYGEASRRIYKLAKESNDKGRIFVLWGTCLGFEALPYAETGADIRTKCDVNHEAMSLDFVEGYRDSKLFQNLSEDIREIISTKNVNYNYHEYCLYEESFKKIGIDSEWQILSTNADNDNKHFISAMENIKYPFYGVQFHPEKNAFEFQVDQGFPHFLESVKATQFFANFLVQEARKSVNKFPTRELALRSMIYNYNPKFSESDGNYYSQIYGFSTKDYENQLL